MTDKENFNQSDDIRDISINDEMKRSYLDYAMSVIVSRALPDVRDGLKPVHRRILYSCHENNYDWNRAYRKSARVVGDVIGKYHPHGDSSVYEALVRMAQPFSMGAMLIDGQGNFGSVDGDPPAAMRYTEVRLRKIAHSLLADLDKDTVDFVPNYDNSEKEPSVLPVQFPNLLVNGSNGIAVGMATNIPPHNLGEVIDGCLELLNDPYTSEERLIELIPGPDFPTGGEILGYGGARGMHINGRGSVVVRAKAEIETFNGERERIIVNELPYQVNKAALIERIAELVREKKLEGISDLRDESDRDGMRVVIEIKRDASAQIVLNSLYKQTNMLNRFSSNLVALHKGKPQVMNIRQMLEAFLEFREETVIRLTKYDLNKTRDRAHILVGLALAVANIDEVIRIIRSSPDAQTAKETLLAKKWKSADVIDILKLVDDPRNIIENDQISLSEEQVRAILDLRLQRLTQIGRDEIDAEMKNLSLKIADLLDLLGDRSKLIDLIKNELISIKEEFAIPRRSIILEAEDDIDDEDLIMKEDMVVTLSHEGYIKRVPLSSYRAQRRGGKGRSAMKTKEEDFVAKLLVANTHTPLLFFTSKGMVYQEKVWKLPLGSPQNRGKALLNYLPIDNDERITSILPVFEQEKDPDLMFVTRSGMVRRNKMSDFTNVNRAGKIAMKLDEDDCIVDVLSCHTTQDVLITTREGQAIRFSVEDVRLFKGRDSIGVRGIRLSGSDNVISMAIINSLDATSEERAAYLKHANSLRKSLDNEVEASEIDSDITLDTDDVQISQERYAQMSASEQFILTVSENGYAKRTSSFEYRKTARGGKGITAMVVNDRNGGLVASFPVDDGDQLIMVTNGGKVIRCPLDDIRIAGRVTQGVTVLRTNEDEKVVSVESLKDDGSDDDDAIEHDNPDTQSDSDAE